MSKKMGRPPKLAGESKMGIVGIRFTEEEKKALEAVALSEGKKLSPWAREILLSHLPK